MNAIAVHLNLDTGEVGSDFGLIDYPSPDPDHNKVGPLMLTTADYLRELLRGPRFRGYRRCDSVTVDGNRVFANLDYGSRRWTWELYPAYFSDDSGPHNLIVGRWPD